MVQGANAYLKFRPRVDISLISAVIFSLFGAAGDEPIMQFRYPEDTDLIDGIIYIGFTQEQTTTLYEASGGAVEMEIQINLGDKTAVKPCTQRIQIRRSRETEIIEGNQPDYKLPDQVIDLETGTVVLLRGEKGEPGEKGAPGSDATVTAASIESALGFKPASADDVADKEFVVSIFEQLKALIEAGKTDEARAVLDKAILDLAVLA